MNEIGKERKDRVDAFTVEFNALLKQYGVRMWGDDDGDLHLEEASTSVRLGWLEYKEAADQWEMHFRREAIDPEGYARDKDLATVPMPAERPQEYEAWKQRHPSEAQMFEQAIGAGYYATKPTEQYAFTTTPQAQQRYQERQDFYRGGTRGLSSEDMGYHGVNWTWLAGYMAGGTPGPAVIYGRNAALIMDNSYPRQQTGGTPDPKEYRP